VGTYSQPVPAQIKTLKSDYKDYNDDDDYMTTIMAVKMPDNITTNNVATLQGTRHKTLNVTAKKL